MQIKDEDHAVRVGDAYLHDEVMVMVGDPQSGRPILTLSVTKDGQALIEYEPGDLAAGIRQLNQIISQGLRGKVALKDLRVLP